VACYYLLELVLARKNPSLVRLTLLLPLSFLLLSSSRTTLIIITRAILAKEAIYN